MQVASMRQAPMGTYRKIVNESIDNKSPSFFTAEESHFDDFHMLKKRPPKQLEVPGNGSI